MNTVYWLAVLVAVLCIGRFACALLYLTCIKSFGSGREQLAVKVNGVMYFLPLLPLFIGVGAVIVILTLPVV